MTRGAQWPLSLAALLLGLAPVAPAQELVSSLLTRAAVAPPGASITIDLLTVNPGTADAPLATAELLSGRVLAGEREWPVQLQSRPNASTHVSAGGFAARTFTLVLPPDATGRLILEVQPPAAKGAPVPPPLRAVLDVQAGAAAPPAGNAQAQSVLTTLTPPAAELQRSFFGRFSAHEPVYFIYGPDAPAAKFQFSFKYRVLNFGHSDSGTQRPTLNFGYTQRSLWELGSSSSPFYDTSYIPSLFVEWLAPRQDAGAGLALLGLQGGLQHESNGQPAPDSRSLNTVFARASVVIGPTDGFHVVASPRLFGYVASLSDNRELARYRGHGDVQLQFGRSDGVQLGYTGRIGTGFHNPSTQLDLTIPVHTRWLDFASYFLIQYFDGYGENLRDYDQHIQTIRAGVSLLR